MRIEGLSFKYQDSWLFSAFNFSIADPMAILCGRSGCGKTTLLKILCGVMRPNLVDVFDVPKPSRLILQEDALFPWMTVAQNFVVAFGSDVMDSAGEPLEPIRHLLNQRVYELSYGQRRLVELCRAFITPPEMLCLDEPFNFLDSGARTRLAFQIKALIGQGRQVILTTHHEDDVALFEAPVFRFPEITPVQQLLRDSSICVK